MTTSLFRAWDQYGAKGQRWPFANAGRFQQIQFGGYLELGMSKRWTLVMNAPFSNLQYSDSLDLQESGGLGDLEIGVRRRFNGLSSSWAVSGQFTATVPGYKATLDPALGNHQEDAEGRLLVGRGTSRGERHWFWDGEAAYRYRTGAPAGWRSGWGHTQVCLASACGPLAAAKFSLLRPPPDQDSTAAGTAKFKRNIGASSRTL